MSIQRFIQHLMKLSRLHKLLIQSQLLDPIHRCSGCIETLTMFSQPITDRSIKGHDRSQQDDKCFMQSKYLIRMVVQTVSYIELYTEKI